MPGMCLHAAQAVLPALAPASQPTRPPTPPVSEKCDFQRPLEDLDDTMTVVTVADMPDYQRRYALEPLVSCWAGGAAWWP